MLFKLAWRNIWRNKRRTFITLAMIQFAVVLATFMSAFRYGVLDAQVENVVGGYQGYGAINDTAFVNEPNIENTVPFNDSIKHYLNEKAVIKAYSPRILGVGMMTCGEKFKITGYNILYRDEAEGRPQTLEEANIKTDGQSDGATLQEQQQKFVTYLLNNGYPNAKIVTRRALAEFDKSEVLDLDHFAHGRGVMHFGHRYILGADPGLFIGLKRGKPGQEMRNVALRWLVAFVGHFVALHRPLYGTSRRNRRAMGHNPVDISKLGSRCHSVSKDCRSRSIRAQKFGNSIGWRLGSMPLQD